MVKYSELSKRFILFLAYVFNKVFSRESERAADFGMWNLVFFVSDGMHRPAEELGSLFYVEILVGDNIGGLYFPHLFRHEGE